MRPPIEFLKYEGLNDTDILQEYFVPAAHFSAFMDELRRELLHNDVNLLSVTLRYLLKNDESILSYATDDMIAIVLYVNIEINDASIKHAGNWTRKLVNMAIDHKGTYYLTYQRYPTLEQFQTAYPDWYVFNRIKCEYDPNLVLRSKFYDAYLYAALNKPVESGKAAARREPCLTNVR